MRAGRHKETAQRIVCLIELRGRIVNACAPAGIEHIARDEKRQAAGVRPTCFAHGCLKDVCASGRHAAVRMCDHHDSVDAEQVRGEHERAEDVVGDAGAGVAQNLRVAGPQTEHRERLDARVYAGENGETLRRVRLQPSQREAVRVRLVRREHVGECARARHARIVKSPFKCPSFTAVARRGVSIWLNQCAVVRRQFNL